jgi:hypothetical protein
MDCEKYSRLITGEVLGGLTPERERGLREHVAQCARCKEEFDHARAAFAAVDRGVEALVAGEPSPQFAARLRARIANDHAPTRLEWRLWLPVAAGAFVLAAVLVVVMIRMPQQSTRESAPVRQAPPNPTEASIAANSKIEIPGKRPSLAADAIQPSSRTKYRIVQARQPEILVPRGQLAAIMQFANVVNAGDIDTEQMAAAQEQAEQPLKIEAIQISPLSIPQLDDSNGKPEIPGGF